jgi:hypothetical protein
MKKIVIPTILIATMMIGLTLAIMPVEKAATVHTTIQNNQATPFAVTVSDATVAAAVRDFTLDCTTDCIVTGIIAQSTAQNAATNICAVRAVEVDGIQTRADIAAPADDVVATDLANTADSTNIDEHLEQLFTGFTAPTTVDLATATTAGAAVDVLNDLGFANGGIAALNGGIGPNPAGARDVVVEVNCSVVGATSTVEVTFSGYMVGTTEPTGAVGADA